LAVYIIIVSVMHGYTSS